MKGADLETVPFFDMHIARYHRVELLYHRHREVYHRHGPVYHRLKRVYHLSMRILVRQNTL